MRKRIKERLIALRRKVGYSAKELSVLLHKNEYYISKMEKGVFFPSVKELEHILNACNSSLEELFYDEFDKFHFEKEMIEKFRAIGQKEKDAILTLLVMAFEKLNKRKGEN